MTCPNDTKIIHLSCRMFFVFEVINWLLKGLSCWVLFFTQFKQQPWELYLSFGYVASLQMPRFSSQQEILFSLYKCRLIQKQCAIHAKAVIWDWHIWTGCKQKVLWFFKQPCLISQVLWILTVHIPDVTAFDHAVQIYFMSCNSSMSLDVLGLNTLAIYNLVYSFLWLRNRKYGKFRVGG